MNHLEEAKSYLRKARNQLYEKGAHEGVQNCIYAMDEVIRHLDRIGE